MDVKEYIASGILELYVAGILSEKENLEVHTLAMEHPEIQSEIEQIEASILALTKTASPGLSSDFDTLKEKLKTNEVNEVISLPKRTFNWKSYTGWAAAAVFAIGLFWMYDQNQDLELQIVETQKENQQLEQQIVESNTSIEKAEDLLRTIRDKNISVTTLAGQAVSPTSFAKAYWNKENKQVFIDAQGLPEPPDGFVYQVWSLKLNPLTPSSLGLLNDFATDENKVFALNNSYASEAFGITLEPAGGSLSPNLEQLYTLGAVSDS